MNLYRVYIRQDKPADSQYHSCYAVWAPSETQARLFVGRRLRHAVIKDVCRISSVTDGPILLVECG